MRGARLDYPRFDRVVVTAVVVLLVPSMFSGLAGDDFVHWIRASTGYPTGSRLDLFGFATGSPSYARVARDMGLLPWFGLEDLRLRFLRPLSSLTHFVDYNAWPSAPALMHAESMALYVALVVVATRLYRRLIPSRWTASLAALMYAFDPGHGTVGWIAGRNGILAGALGVLCVLAHDRDRQRVGVGARVPEGGARARAWAGPILFGVALLAGEAAVGALAYLLAYALTLDPAPTRARRALSVSPYVAILLAWQAVYRALGYGAYGSTQYIDPGRETGRFLVELPGRAAALLAGQVVLFPSELHMYMSRGQLGALMAAVAALLALLAWLALPLLRREPSARFFACGALLALPAVCAVFPSSRNLTFVGFGVLGLFAQMVSDARAATAAGVRAALGRAVEKGIVAIHVFVAPLAFLLSSLVPASMVGWVAGVSEGLPTASDLVERTAVVVNGPMLLVAELRFFLPLDGTIRGPHGRLLSSTAGTVTLTRTAADAFTLRADDLMGEPWSGLVRDPSHPMTEGETVATPGMTARVDSVASNGHPSAATFHFDAPLETPKYAWMGWDHGRFVRVTLPPVGGTIALGGP